MIDFASVWPPFWNGRPVFLIGGGASLADFDLARLRGLGYIVGINQAMFDASFCDAGISIDDAFINHNAGRLLEAALRCELYLVTGRFKDHVPVIPRAIYIRKSASDLSLLPDEISGSTSGYAALNLAVLKQAKRIVLLGFDYGLIDGRHHYHDAYWWHHKANDQSWGAWAKRFDDAAPLLKERGIEVINASPHSAVTAFPKMTIEQALNAVASAPYR